MDLKRQIHLFLPENEFKLFSANCKKYEYISASSMLSRLMREYNQKVKEKQA